MTNKMRLAERVENIKRSISVLNTSLGPAAGVRFAHTGTGPEPVHEGG